MPLGSVHVLLPAVSFRSMLPWLCVCSALCALPPGTTGRSLEWFTALVRTEYTDPLTNTTVLGTTESGRYGESSPKDSVQGLVGFPRDPWHLEGCHVDTQYSVPGMSMGALEMEGAQPWIALVARGGCSFKDKVVNAARRRASAVVIFNEAKSGNATESMSHVGTGNTVVIMVGYPKGVEIMEPLRRGIPVKMVITVGTRHVQEFISGQSVVFVAIAFITMMIISLAWLIFYYIQRFLYTGAQFGNQGNRKETKKAISQLQLHRVKKGEKGIDIEAENCPVCIENYKPKDLVRILPCKHIFHRLCIDPWLIEHRTCPMCKLDVIKALGFWDHIGNFDVPSHMTDHVGRHVKRGTGRDRSGLGAINFSARYYSPRSYRSVVEPEEPLEIPVPLSIAGSSLSIGTLSITQEENRNEVNNLPSSSTGNCSQQCTRTSVNEDAGETTALLDDPSNDETAAVHHQSSQ